MNVATNVAQDFLNDNKQSILTIVQPNECFRDLTDSEDDELDMFIFCQLKRSIAKKRKSQAEDKNQTAKKSNNLVSNVELIDDNAQQPPPSASKALTFATYLQQSVGSTFSNHFKMTKSTFEVKSGYFLL